MPSIRDLTPQIDPEKDVLVKLQVWVPQSEKRAILAAIGDDGAFTFVIRTTFQRLATYVRTNNLTAGSPSDFKLFVEFVRNGTDSRSDRPANVVDDGRTATRLQHANASATSSPGSTSESRSGRSGKQVGKTKSR